MTSLPEGANLAAFLLSKQGQLTIQERNIPKPQEGQVLIRNHAVAANPADWKIQKFGVLIEKFPAILGSDVAGTIVSVGPGVTRFKVGDRVIGFAQGTINGTNDEAGFQSYLLLSEIGTTHLPDRWTFEQGAVLPVGLTTAAIALFADLQLPMTRRPAEDSGALLIWSASGAVGVSAVQIAHSLGWPVYVTASPKNHEWLKQLGATEAWDYGDPSAPQKIGEAVQRKGIQIRGVIDGFSEGSSLDSIIATLVAAKADSSTAIAQILPWPADKEKPEGYQVIMTLCGRFSKDRQDIGKWLFAEWLENGLQDGTVQVAPRPRVIEGGIQATQQILDILSKGVSGEKVVLKL